MNVFKISVEDGRVRKFLERRGWENQGKDIEMEMDSYKNKITGKKVYVEDISDSFPVTFLMGDFTTGEFCNIAHALVPRMKLMEVKGRWEGRPTNVVVAMTVEQVMDVFGKKTKMRELAVDGTELTTNVTK